MVIYNICLNRGNNTNSLYCPDCSTGLINLVDKLNLIESIPREINIKIPAEKGKSEPITIIELELLCSYLGNIKKIQVQELTNSNDKIIMTQSFINNCWWIGLLKDYNNNKITIDNSIYIQRYNGKIYNSDPKLRVIELRTNDSIYLVF